MAGGTPAEKARRAAERKNYNVTHPGEHDMAWKAHRYNVVSQIMRDYKGTTSAPTQRGRAVITGNRGGAVVNKGNKKTVTSKPAPKPSMSGASGTASPGLASKSTAVKKPGTSSTSVKPPSPPKMVAFKYV